MSIEETKKEFGLGRIAVPDERDKLFLAKAVVEDQPITRTSRYHFANGWWGDQGNSPHCVGYSCAHFVEDGPITQPGVAPVIDPVTIYTEAQKIDAWPGEEYEGTSVRAGVKYLQSLGVISEYRWAWDLATLVRTILTTSPAIVGTLWYEDMFYPDANGIIRVGGYIAGGHAYVVDGVNTKTQLFRIKNSWGRNWGKKGFAYISFADMERLIHDSGEICLPLENKLVITSQ